MARENSLKTDLSYYIQRKVSAKETTERIERLIEQGEIARVRVEGFKENFLIRSSDQAHLSVLEAGRIPKIWKPKGPTTEEEVTLLAPLEIVSARGRAKRVFDFEYVWEVYKPAHQRKWGYYTLPILYGDDLVARLDPKLDRTTNTLHILGFWLEDDAPKDVVPLPMRLPMGLKRFADMIGAKKIDLSGVKPVKTGLVITTPPQRTQCSRAYGERACPVKRWKRQSMRRRPGSNSVEHRISFGGRTLKHSLLIWRNV
jgi:uncharacterized protein YcaQ